MYLIIFWKSGIIGNLVCFSLYGTKNQPKPKHYQRVNPVFEGDSAFDYTRR